MIQSDYRALASSSGTSSSISSNPFTQRINPMSDMVTFMNRARNAADITTKLEMYEQILKDIPANMELSRFYTVLLSDIFGLDDFPGWKLHSPNRKSPKDEALIKMVYDFMVPEGNLFKLIEKLEYENATYQFPSIMLPSNVQDQIQRNCSSLIASKAAGIVPGSRMAISSNISALEYYLLIFFGYILQPKIQKEPMDWNADVLYVSLYEAYLRYFLPLNGPERHGLDNELQSSSRPILSRQERLSRLPPSNNSGRYGNIPIFNDGSVYNRESRSIIVNSGLSNSHPIIRKSEVFIEILKELWLGYKHIEVQDYSLPGVDQVMMIRIFIKYLHHFMNEAAPNSKNEIPPLSTSISQKDELKRVIMPMVQKNLYNFFKNCFLHWPLDASFKAVREAWLSYIQPWRYRNSSDQDSLKSLDEWFEFIEANLVFYTVLFRMFMQRAARLDLQLPRDVQFICRVTKVFSNLNFPQLLHRAENSVLSSSHSGAHPLTYSRLDPSYIQLCSSPRSTGLEDEPYESLFDQEYVKQMQEVAGVLFSKAEAIRRENSSQRSTAKVDHSFIGRLKAFLTQKSDAEEDSNDRELQENLIKASNQLAAIFNFDPPVSTEPAGEHTVLDEGRQLPKPFISDKCYDDGRLLPEHIIESDGSVTLTEKGRLQILHRLRHFNIQGKATTELEPVKSYEFPTLVRLLHQLTTKLNEKYEKPLKMLYNREDIVGRTLRTLSPKVVEFRGISVQLPPAQQIGAIQPRFSLRFLASYHAMYYTLWLFLIFKLFDVGILPCVLILILLFVLFTLQNVVPTPLKFKQK